jgi:LmbE family N-acetylglucosaminyl deacetylase
VTILVIAAHPDDEVLGCGATMALESASHEVRVLILGEGISSRHHAREAAARGDLESLRADSRAAVAEVGATSVDFGGLPDNRFDELALLDVVKQVESWIVKFKPQVIYTHHPGDLNIDHGITFRAVLTATRPGAGGSSVRDILTFEVPSSTEWAFQRIEPSFRPNVFVDITSTIERKIAAMERYRTEARPSPHPRSPEALRALAEYRGAAAGSKYAEAFELIRSLRP